MSTRERWIVYPILFLTLGIALRDKLFPPDLRPLSVDAGKIRCHELEVGKLRGVGSLEVDQLLCHGVSVLRDKGSRPCLRLVSAPSGAGRVEVFGEASQPVFVAGADASGVAGLVEVCDARGRPQAQLGSGPAGGSVTLFDQQEEIEVTLGHDGQGLALVGRFLRLDRQTPLTLPCRWRDVRRQMALEK